MYGSSWKMSSGCITGAERVSDTDDWNLPQSSGSNYHIRYKSEGVCGGWSSVLSTFADGLEGYGGKLEIIDSPDFSKLKEEFV
jgi:hypothetical protein